MYQKLLNSGWRWSTSGSKLANYTYFNPGIKNIKDGEHGKDYFFSEEELKFYIMNNYGWVGPKDVSKEKTRYQKRSHSTVNESDKEMNTNDNHQGYTQKAKSKKVKSTRTTVSTKNPIMKKSN